GFEALLLGEGIGRGAGEAGQDLVVVQAADLAGRALDDDVAQGDLAIAAQRDAVAAAHADDGGGVKLFHAFLPMKALAGGEAGDFKARRPRPRRPLSTRQRNGKGPPRCSAAALARRAISRDGLSRRTASGASRAVPALRATGWRWGGPAGGECRWVRRFPRTSRIRRCRCGQ